MKRIFMSANRQLRPGWKIIASMLGSLLISALVYLVLGGIYSLVVKKQLILAITYLMNDTWWGYPLSALMQGVLFLGFFMLLARYEKMPPAAFGLKPVYWPRIFSGFAFGLFIMGIIILPFYLSGSYQLAYKPFTLQILAALALHLIIYLSVAATEELLFRGYIHHLLLRYGALPACFMSAALFACIHLVNSSYSFASLLYLFVGGFLFSAMRLATNNLFYLIGFHWAWNWVLQVMGINNQRIPWLQTSVAKNTIWNGGTTGPEAGVWGLIILAALAGAYLFIWQSGGKSRNLIQAEEVVSL